MRGNRYAALLLGLVSPWVSAPVLSAQAEDHGLTPEEKRGKQIYFLGTTDSERKIVARFGEALIKVPASALPCANCHGFDGRGRPEGGVTPPDIRWQSLQKPYAVKGAGGRTHPAYTDRSLRSAITQGLDPGKNRLATTMPRYELTHEEIRDLIAFIKRVGNYTDPGLTSDSIRLGCVLPGDESHKVQAEGTRRVLEAFFADVNELGGIHGRRVELRFRVAGSTAQSTTLSVSQLLEEDAVFALIASVVQHAEAGVVRILGEQQVPLVGALTDNPQVGFPLNRFVFYLFPGLRDQLAAMLEFAGRRSAEQPPTVAILWPSEPGSVSIVDSLAEVCRRSEWPAPVRVEYDAGEFDAPATVRRLQSAGVDAVFLLGSGSDQTALARAAERAAWQPSLFIPGHLADNRILETTLGATGRVFLSFPRGPRDQTRAGIEEFVAFARKHELQQEGLSEQVAAYCSAKVLSEALKRSGRALSREKLTQTLEGLYEFETGLIPHLTFGPNRRVGARGAYVATIDPQTRRLTPVSEWIEVD